MLKKIPVNCVRSGMYIHSLEGSWLSHPFWKGQFLLDKPEDLVRLRQSELEYVFIDTTKGVDVAESPAVPSAPPAPPSPSPAQTPVAPVVATLAHCSVGDELQRAVRLLDQSKEAITHLFNEARMGNAIKGDECLPLVLDISDSLARNGSALIGLARLKRADEYTYMHSVAVCALMISLGRQLGLDETAVREAGLAGLLHDVGKMLMPMSVLNKPSRLTDAEFAVMQSHPERGHALLVASGSIPASTLDVCLHHHERIDGSGYPYRLKGSEISLFARMAAVCDVYDAVTSNRSYKKAWNPAESLSRMAQWEGHFDKRVFHAFVRSVGIYPLGSLVRLESGRLGVVIDQHAEKLTEPLLRVFFSVKSNAQIRQFDLDLSDPLVGDRIVGREDPAQWGFSNLDDFWR